MIPGVLADGEQFFEIIKGEETMRSTEPLAVLPVAAFDFSVVALACMV